MSEQGVGFQPTGQTEQTAQEPQWAVSDDERCYSRSIVPFPGTNFRCELVLLHEGEHRYGRGGEKVFRWRLSLDDEYARLESRLAERDAEIARLNMILRERADYIRGFEEEARDEVQRLQAQAARGALADEARLIMFCNEGYVMGCSKCSSCEWNARYDALTTPDAGKCTCVYQGEDGQRLFVLGCKVHRLEATTYTPDAGKEEKDG
jgi:hypothetical protein